MKRFVTSDKIMANSGTIFTHLGAIQIKASKFVERLIGVYGFLKD